MKPGDKDSLTTQPGPGGDIPCRALLGLSCPDRFSGSGKRFHWRRYNDRFEVYSVRLFQWAECDSPEKARIVADALEQFYSSNASAQRMAR